MSIDEMSRKWLPLNRKERYYTGTVLPQIVRADDFAYFGRFLNLIGLEDRDLKSDPSCTNIQFFTEYSLSDSVRYPDSSKEFPSLPEAGDTPDILIMLGEPKPTLIVIEAKMFTSPLPSALVAQIHRQEEYVVRYLKEHRGEFDTCIVALLPSDYADKVEAEASKEDLSDIRILRWQQLLDAFRDVASARHFVGVEAALARHSDLRSRKSSSGANMDRRMPGADIVAGFRAGDLEFKTMGRGGGIGRVVREDVPDSRWRSQLYEVSFDEIPANGNWFEIARFVRLVEDFRAS